MKSSALLRVPSKIVGGTPRIPPFEGMVGTGAVVVTFTDMVSWGGSRGSDPCKVTIGPSASAKTSSSGPGATTASSKGSFCGPQVSVGWFSGSESE